jgi:para-nitrobenzyl esterase
MASIAETTYGQVAGESNDGVHTFRGIPYGRPPVGGLRFRASQPPEPWTGVREATSFGSIAMQNPSPLEGLFGAAERPPMNEDCLYLNVWTPGLDSARRPVMVWIHGGAFVTGSGSTPWYDGTRFASRGDVVVVTINYRLGALGFLHLTDLAGESFAGSGNAGILDQAAALAWVRDNIAAFGGDPGNVTIFGESAGAMSVGTLLALPAARGLFHRAILQSGAASNAMTRERANEVAGQMLEALNIPREQAATIRDVPVADLLAAQAKVYLSSDSGGLPFQPMVDGDSLPELPLDAVGHGSASGVSVLAGTTRDEMRLFTAFDPSSAVKDEADLLARCVPLFGSEERGRRAIEAYRQARPEGTVADVWPAIMTDQVFRVPAARLLDRQSAQTDQTWSYLFAWATPAFGGALGSCHALEIPFVFNNLDKPGASALTGPVTPEMQTLAEHMQDAWIAFARTGDPNHAGLPRWERYEPQRRATMIFDTACALEDNAGCEQLALWEEVPA